jgi:DNA polymerase-3 subunit epsilon
VTPVSRDAARKKHHGPPSFLQRLLALSNTAAAADPDNEASLAYTALLDRVLEDRRLDEVECLALLNLATHWGLSGAQVRELHTAYLGQLAQAAAADGVVTEVERQDLLQVAQLLGETSATVDDMLAETTRSPAGRARAPDTLLARAPLAGKRVCFTGELQCRLHGEPIPRSTAAELAADHGLVVVESVTKKLDLLVVADPFTQSGKAKTARRYGVRIMHEPVFWQALGITVE